MPTLSWFAFHVRNMAVRKTNSAYECIDMESRKMVQVNVHRAGIEMQT